MIVPEATPIATPASSPLVIVVDVSMLCARPPLKNTLNTLGIAVEDSAIFTKGVGTGPAGVVTLHTSGIPKLVVPFWLLQNTLFLLPLADGPWIVNFADQPLLIGLTD